LKTTRLFVLVEAYLEGALGAREREELVAAVKADPAMRARFVEQVWLARRLRASLRPHEGDLWSKIAPLVGEGAPERRRQLADRVDALIDERQAPRSRRWRWAAGGAVLAAATAAAAILVSPRRPPRPVSPPLASEPAITERATAPGIAERPPLPLSPPPPVVARPLSPPVRGAPVDPRAAMRAELQEAEGPALAQRPDIHQFVGFDGPLWRSAVLARFGPRLTDLGPGLSGRGLRVYFPSNGMVLRGGGAWLSVSSAAQTSEPPRDELHLRYYVRLSEEFDFGGGGFLPGLCVGPCMPPRRLQKEGGIIRPHWTPFSELVFDPLPNTRPKDRRWQRFLARATWHAVELHVKLNTPGASDGVVEGWFDGEKAVSLSGLRLRETGETHLEEMSFVSMFRARKRAAPTRDGQATFDDIVVASSYIGPRKP
jgi:hypothetical protein